MCGASTRWTSVTLAASDGQGRRDGVEHAVQRAADGLSSHQDSDTDESSREDVLDMGGAVTGEWASTDHRWLPYRRVCGALVFLIYQSGDSFSMQIGNSPY